MRPINAIFLHCSYTPVSMDIGVHEIRQWHTDPKPEGNAWSDVGYHYIIRRSGVVEPGRDIKRAGAHARGHNSDTIGVCLVGGMSDQKKPEFNYTARQLQSLRRLMHTLCSQYHLTESNIRGHNEVSSKECPCFNVQEFFSTGVLQA